MFSVLRCNLQNVIHTSVTKSFNMNNLYVIITFKEISQLSFVPLLSKLIDGLLVANDRFINATLVNQVLLTATYCYQNTRLHYRYCVAVAL